MLLAHSDKKCRKTLSVSAIAVLLALTNVARMFLPIFPNRHATRARQRPLGPSQWIALAVLLFAVSPSQQSRADEFMSSSRFHRQLVKPLSMEKVGPFRETILTVAKQSETNVWIDRHVDPSALVNPGPLGPTVYAGLVKVAAERDCVVFPVANVVLVGRENWVDACAAGLMSLPKTSSTANVAWSQLTTPSEAFAAATDQAKTFRLPHDLWPATSLNLVSRPAAANLVVSQFGRRLKSTKDLDPNNSVLLDFKKKATRIYSANETLESTIRQKDPLATIKRLGKKTSVTAVARTHRIAAELVLKNTAGAPRVQGQVADDARTYSLNLVNKPVGAVIQEFAAKAKLKCDIKPEALVAAGQIITMSAEDKTLKELIELAAKHANLKIDWFDGGFSVTVTDD